MHKYRCTICDYHFVISDSQEYNDDPKERDCPKCESARGQIAYEGFHGTLPFVNSDNLGTHGVFNPADGKRYDSKSAYYGAVKAAGLVINDSANVTQSKPKLKEINWERAVAETIKTLSPTKKGKKK